mmetsp:Transcript_27317/g.59571  ORF Transcript_27317/g.59571 Transcript_27317/m.59571 type:complete len:208 (-) Transcript_27317:417-1040(-)
MLRNDGRPLKPCGTSGSPARRLVRLLSPKGGPPFLRTCRRVSSPKVPRNMRGPPCEGSDAGDSIPFSGGWSWLGLPREWRQTTPHGSSRRRRIRPLKVHRTSCGRSSWCRCSTAPSAVPRRPGTPLVAPTLRSAASRSRERPCARRAAIPPWARACRQVGEASLAYMSVNMSSKASGSSCGVWMRTPLLAVLPCRCLPASPLPVARS